MVRWGEMDYDDFERSQRQFDRLDDLLCSILEELVTIKNILHCRLSSEAAGQKEHEENQDCSEKTADAAKLVSDASQGSE